MEHFHVKFGDHSCRLVIEISRVKQTDTQTNEVKNPTPVPGSAVGMGKNDIVIL